MRWWAFWRRVEYGTGFLIVLGLLGTGVYYMYGYSAPTCFDLIKNGEEADTDCGGACIRVCPFQITQPTALWSESFRTTEGQYNAVTYIENRNIEVGTPSLRYIFKLFDDEGLITEREGSTVLPPDSVYPVFEGRILTGGRVPTKTTIEFVGESVWVPGTTGREQFTLEKRDLVNADSKPKLTAELRNTSLDEARDVEVVATIFDVSRNPLATSRAVVPYFAGRSTQEVIFTWPEPIAKTLRSCETPTDVVLAIDLSGSMNNDGGTPPEPISSVLISAEAFVSRMKKQDQIGIVTYATNATTNEALTHDTARVGGIVSKLSIDPKEERGSTNIGDALKHLREELNGSNHSPDARKVAILLTDGLATAPEKDPELYALTEATLLKESGVQLFTIGLGEGLNEEFLKSVATNESMYNKAPTTNELDSIYRSITGSICEDGPAVIEIIPKAVTSFTSLQ